LEPVLTKNRHIDLRKTLNAQLLKAGIPEINIEHINDCTFENSCYHSYRREKTNNRQINIVGIIHDKTYTNKEGNLILEIRDEPLSAWLTIKKTGKLIDEYAIIALLEEAGIKSGFEEAVEYAQIHSLEKEFDIPFPLLCVKRMRIKQSYAINLIPIY
jgi:hypothetical protein